MRAVSHSGETLKDSPIAAQGQRIRFPVPEREIPFCGRGADRNRRRFPLPYVNARKTSDLNRRSALPLRRPGKKKTPENPRFIPVSRERLREAVLRDGALACGLQRLRYRRS